MLIMVFNYSQAFLCYMDTCECINTSESHLGPISEVRFQPRTTIFATSSPDKTVKLWDSNNVRVSFFSFHVCLLPLIL